MAIKHPRPRDLPHHASENRKRKFADGAVYGERKRTAREYAARDPKTKEWLGAGTAAISADRMETKRSGDGAPRRPPFCMLFDDLAECEQPAGVFGMYPAILIAKLLPWLKCDRRHVLHVCSGGLARGEGIRVDMRAAARPDIIADGRALPLADASVAAVLLDPPYSEHYARELYGVDYPRPAHLLAEAARVVRPGGRIGFVHYIVPNPPAGTHFVKVFGLSMGFGYPTRAVTFYERDQESLFQEKA